MSIRETSITAYGLIQATGKANTQKALIYKYLQENGAKTRRQIAQSLNMETSTVSARVNSLRDDYRLVTDHKTCICPISKKTVHLVEVVK